MSGREKLDPKDTNYEHNLMEAAVDSPIS